MRWSYPRHKYDVAVVDTFARLEDLLSHFNAMSGKAVGFFSSPLAGEGRVRGFFLVLVLLALSSPSWAQMSHAVIYSPSKQVEVKPDPVEVKPGLEDPKAAALVVVPDIRCELTHKWVINTYKTHQVWYAYVAPEELKCVQEAGDIKFWFGATAKEAWIAAYKSGLPDAVALFEQNAKYPVTVFDSEQGKQVEKMVPVADAKALGVKIEQSVIDRQGDAMLPRKIFDGSK